MCENSNLDVNIENKGANVSINKQNENVFPVCQVNCADSEDAHLREDNTEANNEDTNMKNLKISFAVLKIVVTAPHPSNLSSSPS